MKWMVFGVVLSVSFVIGEAALAAAPDEQNSGSLRMEFFARTQVTCKLVVLGNAEKGAAFVALLANSDKTRAATSTSPTRGQVKLLHLMRRDGWMVTRSRRAWQPARRRA
jgi:hypothetical protein